MFRLQLSVRILGDTKNIQIVQQYNTQKMVGDQIPTAVHQQTLQNQAEYKKVSQIAYYSTLTKIEKLEIFTKSTCDVECNITFCYYAGKYQENMRKEIMYFVIRTLNEEIPKLKNRYYIAYVHDNLNSFLFFRDLVKLLPSEFLAKMKQFFVVDGGPMVKIAQVLGFGQINAYIKEKTRYLDRLDEIQKLNKATLGGDIKPIKSHNHPVETLMLTHELDESDTKIIRNKLYGKGLDEYPVSAHGIPIHIQEMIMRLYSNSAFLKFEGIMRKSCDVEQLQLLQESIMNDETNWKTYIRNLDNPYVLCGCIKKIFNNLNTPLFSFQIYNIIKAFRSDGQPQNDLTFFSDCISKMKPTHRQILLYTIAFLKKGIITNVQLNKMSAYNLAVVFGPCFFRPKQYKLEDLMNSGKFSFAIKILLERFEDVVGQKNAYRMYTMLDQQKLEYLSN